MSNLAIPLGLYDMDYDHVMREGKVITKPADTSNTPSSTDEAIDSFATTASPLEAALASIWEPPYSTTANWLPQTDPRLLTTRKSPATCCQHRRIQPTRHCGYAPSIISSLGRQWFPQKAQGSI